jgi:hypothetical protein
MKLYKGKFIAVDHQKIVAVADENTDLITQVSAYQYPECTYIGHNLSFYHHILLCAPLQEFEGVFPSHPNENEELPQFDG